LRPTAGGSQIARKKCSPFVTFVPDLNENGIFAHSQSLCSLGEATKEHTMQVLVPVRTVTAPRLTADDISLPQFAVVDLTDQPSLLQLDVVRDLAFSLQVCAAPQSSGGIGSEAPRIVCASPLPVTLYSEDDMDAITTIQNALSGGADHRPDDPYIDELVESWLGGRDCCVLPPGLRLPRYGGSWHDGESCGPRCSAKCRLFGSKQGFQVERIHKYEAIVVETGLLPWSVLDDTAAPSGGT
jgi:hypothetical protein